MNFNFKRVTNFTALISYNPKLRFSLGLMKMRIIDSILSTGSIFLISLLSFVHLFKNASNGLLRAIKDLVLLSVSDRAKYMLSQLLEFSYL